MKQISVFDFYVLGRCVDNVMQWNNATLRDSIGADVIDAYEQFTEAARDDSPLLPTAKAAARAVLAAIDQAFHDEMSMGFFPEDGPPKATLGFRAVALQTKIREFESVLRLDAPYMSVFAAPQKGIYQTRALIQNAHEHLPASLLGLLPSQAEIDLIAAGKCLAFEVPTASAFHTWRALEGVADALHEAITGKSFDQAGVTRGWFKYGEALTKAGVDAKITGNLNHIREEYRNPVMHPNENVPLEDAFSLFGVGISAISQILRAIQIHAAAP